MLDKAAGENFPVALRVLPVRVRRQLNALYCYARYVDDLGDEAPGDRTVALLEVAAQVRRLYDDADGADGASVTDPVVAGLWPMVAELGVPADPFLRLVEANLVDQQVTRYTFTELLDYCRLSANPVGEVVLHIFGAATPERIEMSDHLCTGLQLVEHWQDVAEDRRRGRVYLPQEDLRLFGVREQDLDAPRASEAVRALLAFETGRALACLEAGALLLPSLRGWARLAVSGYLAGGRAAAAAIARAGYDTLSATPRAGRRQVAAAWLRASVRSPG
ncbi:squalene synthase HpnC [Actinopolymorpha cephalotaxi]|uniref:Squalene synthase HpnC n=1 Tax=Actinopolymorpha cephalotaxi TaxID=504797 RepID=A0A1I3B1C4_9ACTN|nr:squalene synthase HpnC [Actinopolymorpha cephalotaxi]